MTLDELLNSFTENEDFLRRAEERLDDRQIQLFVNRKTISDEVHLPVSLSHPYTQVVEVFTPNWSDAGKLRSPVIPYLTALCDHWETVMSSHNAATDVFEQARDSDKPYCLYLRSFSHVSDVDISTSIGRAVAYVNREGLDRNVAEALVGLEADINHVTCMHTDDMAFLEGKWVMPGFRVHDHTWKKALSAAIAGAKMIVFYLGKDSSGVQYELDEIDRLGMARRTVIVHESDQAPDGSFLRFGVLAPLSLLVTKKTDLAEPTKLLPMYSDRLLELATDDYEPQPIDARLASLPFAMVDPRMTVDLPKELNPDEIFLVTNSNITAFSWWVQGLPGAVNTWNVVARCMFNEQRAPDRSDVDALWRFAFLGSVGAAALGLVTSLSLMIAVRAISAGIVVEQDPKLRAQRKADLLTAFDIAERFRMLSETKRFGDQIAEMRDAIETDSFG